MDVTLILAGVGESVDFTAAGDEFGGESRAEAVSDPRAAVIDSSVGKGLVEVGWSLRLKEEGNAKFLRAE